MSNWTGLNSSFVNVCPSDVVCLLEVTIAVAVTSLILLGNFVNLIVLLSTPSLRNGHGFLLVSLALADFGIGLVSALTIYPAATFQGSMGAWPYGDTVCLLAAFCSQLFSSVSRLTLTLLSVERYIAVASPLRYSRIVTKKVVLIALVICWLVIGAVNLVTVLSADGYAYVPEMYICQPVIFDNPSVGVVLIICLVVPSFFVILATSGVVSRKLARNARRRAAMTAHTSSERDRERRTQCTPRTVKLFRMVRIMVLVVFVCWVPFFSLATISLIRKRRALQVVVFTAYWLLQSSSFVNTIIYFLMNDAFRKRTDDILGTITSGACLGHLLPKSAVCRRFFFNGIYTPEQNSISARPNLSQATKQSPCEQDKIKNEQNGGRGNNGFQISVFLIALPQQLIISAAIGLHYAFIWDKPLDRGSVVNSQRRKGIQFKK